MFDNRFLPPEGTNIKVTPDLILSCGLVPHAKVALPDAPKCVLNDFVKGINKSLKEHQTLALSGFNARQSANNIALFLLSRGYAVYCTSEIGLRGDIFMQDNSVDSDYTVKTRLQGVHVLIVDGWLSGAGQHTPINDSVCHILELRYKQPYAITIFTGYWDSLKILQHNSSNRFGTNIRRVIHDKTVLVNTGD